MGFASLGSLRAWACRGPKARDALQQVRHGPQKIRHTLGCGVWRRGRNDQNLGSNHSLLRPQFEQIRPRTFWRGGDLLAGKPMSSQGSFFGLRTHTPCRARRSHLFRGFDPNKDWLEASLSKRTRFAFWGCCAGCSISTPFLPSNKQLKVLSCA